MRILRTAILAAGLLSFAACGGSQKGGEDRWNKTIREVGIDFELSLPHRRFHRQIGLFQDHHFDFDGNQLTEAAWNEKKDQWLPSAEDEEYVLSLMKPVHEPGKIVQWIAPPRRGINGNPFDYEYVRFEN